MEIPLIPDPGEFWVDITGPADFGQGHQAERRMAVLVPAIGDLEELPIAWRQTHAEAFLVSRDLCLPGTRRAEPGHTAESVVRTRSLFRRNSPVLGEVLLGRVVHGAKKIAPGVTGVLEITMAETLTATPGSSAGVRRNRPT